MAAQEAPPKTLHAVAYYRVSTEDQGADGLGMEAQRRDVLAWAERHGVAILAEFAEVASGGLPVAQRPDLRAALDLARKRRAVLLVAKQDRASRDHYETMRIEREHRVTIQAATDAPRQTGTASDALNTGIRGVIAEQERREIGDRTRRALASIRERIAREGHHIAKGSGRAITRLGNPAAGSPDLLARAADAKRRAAQARAEGYRTAFQTFLAAGLSYTQIAAALEASRTPTPGTHTKRGGGRWTPAAVSRVAQRLGLADARPTGPRRRGDTPGPISTVTP
jgi:DNA invertase Pin-like site-specific DNA recombinase